ncbi:MAG: hypothetical protein F6J90_08845 [Moorea sp. SIOASIH]|uniref:hypothetical protein n=1 Tax=Moorena sp. SIOASIH TaxID=2607817 RepID=UPI0013BD84E2|nr:hypothetical protein [Moorena sp. SIOASIH]NEO36422.1 hypothetical protein [Moorena sp. SIOASIH]
MNTPSHAIINLAVLNQQTQLQAALPITIGAILPDAPIFILYIWAKLIRRQPEYQIWSQTYELPFWQNLVATFHSLPLALCGVIISHYWGWQLWEILCWSMILHSLLDLPVHNDDAHRHFFPLSNYRFISPFSYWDPKHHGHTVSTLEKLLVLVATIVSFSMIESWIGKSLLIVVNVLYLIAFLYLVKSKVLGFREQVAGSRE